MCWFHHISYCCPLSWICVFYFSVRKRKGIEKVRFPEEIPDGVLEAYLFLFYFPSYPRILIISIYMNNKLCLINFIKEFPFSLHCVFVSRYTSWYLRCLCIAVIYVFVAAREERGTWQYSQQNRYNPQFSSKSSKWSHFSHRSLCFDDETGMRIIRRVKCEGNSD